MNQHLQNILNSIQQSVHLSAEEKDALVKAVKDTEKEFAITEFKLDRTEKVKRTTAILLEETIAELEQKRKDVEAQNRDLEIEAALEKVRSRSLGMQKSDELADLSLELVKQVQALGVATWFCAFNIYNDNDSLEWGSNGQGTFEKYITPREGVFLRYYEAGQRGETLLINEIGEDECPAHYEYLCSLPGVGDQLLQMKAAGIPFPSSQIDHVAFHRYGYLLFVTYEPVPEAHDIFKRFAKVFEQTYTRFLDLQKAEAQAREAQIELALERVRARTMAMQKSDELSDAAKLLFHQIEELGVHPWTSGYQLWDEDRKSVTVWTSTQGVLLPPFKVPATEESLMLHIVNAAEKGETLYVEEMGGEALEKHYGYMFSLPSVLELFGKLDTVGTTAPPTFQVNHAAFFSQGFLLIITLEPVPEVHDIFKRFAKVFEQTYTRFLDLQKAEAQAREAQIEAALERVRSRTLAMQRSNELAETSAVLFQQLILLGIEPNRLYISIVKDDKGETEFWITDEDGSKVSMAYEDNLNNNSSFKKMLAGWKKQQKSLVIDMKGKELQKYFTYLNSIHVPFKGGMAQQRRLQYLAYFNKGFIGMALPDEQPEGTMQLLERFAGVFNLTFTRFNDLKVAEAHALQAEQDLVEIKSARKKAEEALTELQATQKQLIQSEKMASLGELTAGIAHEIQNPLNFVNNFSEVSTELIDEMNEEISKGNLDDAKEIASDLKQNLEKINHHGKRAGEIVKGMLQHSRTSSGQKEPTDINALCDEYLRLAYHGLRAKDKSFNATMKTDFDQGIGKINIIPQDIGRVILNLITNAFYAVNEKSKQNITGYEPIVDVSTKKEGKNVLITVKDNGNGIPKSIVDKIFLPFFTTKPTGQGTGLGLSLSYDIVKAHGGELKVKTLSAEEAGLTLKVDEVNPDDFRKVEGTEFIIQLPFK